MCHRYTVGSGKSAETPPSARSWKHMIHPDNATALAAFRDQISTMFSRGYEAIVQSVYLVPLNELDCTCATCRHVKEVVLAFEDAREADCQVDSKNDCDCVVCHFNKTNDDPGLKVFRIGEDSPGIQHVYAAFITENGGYNPRLHSVFADEDKAEQWLRQKPPVMGIEEGPEWYIERWVVSE